MDRTALTLSCEFGSTATRAGSGLVANNMCRGAPRIVSEEAQQQVRYIDGYLSQISFQGVTGNTPTDRYVCCLLRLPFVVRFRRCPLVLSFA